jgi:hypothetical protein
MVKITTAVKMALGAGLVFAQVSVFADTTSSPTVVNAPQAVDNGAAGLQKDYTAAGCYDHPDTPKCKSMKEDLIALRTLSNGSYDCNSAANNFQKAVHDFSTSCGSAGVSTSGSAGNIACGQAMAQCGCVGHPEATFGSTKCSDVVGGESESSRSDSTEGPDPEETKMRFKYCPAMASKDLDKYRDQLKDAQKDSDDASDKYNDAKKDAQKAQEDAQTKVDDLVQKQDEAQTQYEEAVEKAQKDKDQAQKDIMNQISQLQQQSLQTDDQIAQLDSAKLDAAMKRDETKKQIDLNCFASASATVGKMQSDAIDQIKTGTYSLGSQADLMKHVGMSDRQSWDNLANKYYQWCIASKPTSDSKDSANKIYTSAYNQAAQAQTAARARKAQIQQQIAQLKDPNGNCGMVMQQADGSTNESDMCKATREAAQTQARLDASNARKMAMLGQQIEQARMQGIQAQMDTESTNAELKQRAEDAKTRLQNLKAYVSAADKSSASSDPKSFDDVQAKFIDLKSNAAYLVSCKATASSAGSHETVCAPTDNDCNTAKNFLALVGGEPVVGQGNITPPPSTVDETYSPSNPPSPAPSSGSGTGDTQH